MVLESMCLGGECVCVCIYIYKLKKERVLTCICMNILQLQFSSINCILSHQSPDPSMSNAVQSTASRVEPERGMHSGKPVGTTNMEGGCCWIWFCLMAREWELLCYFLLTKHSTLLPSSFRWEFCHSVLNALQRNCCEEQRGFFSPFAK